MLRFSENPTVQFIQGPAGKLEVLAESPKTLQSGYAIVCHPHPLHQGTMHNKVVYTLAKAFLDVGIKVVRFNYRGVGESAGAYGEGVGESDDLFALVECLQVSYPDEPLYLAGFSFGGYVATRVAHKCAHTKALITVAPSVENFDFSGFSLAKIPWLLVQGDQDEVVEYKSVCEFVKSRREKIQFEVVADCGHFFHGKLTPLKKRVVEFLNGIEYES